MVIMTSPPITRSQGILRRLLDRFGGSEQQDLSGVQNVLYASYQLRGAERNRLQSAIQKRSLEAYQSEIQRQLVSVGCNQSAQVTGTERATLIDRANSDTDSAVSTFNDRLKAYIIKITASNPDASRQEYKAELDQYTRERLSNLNNLIVQATRNNAVAYATERFNANNDLTSGGFVYAGRHPNGQILLPTSSSECIQRVGAGIVDYEYTQANRVPNHPRCPHRWDRVARNVSVDCRSVWRG